MLCLPHTASANAEIKITGVENSAIENNIRLHLQNTEIDTALRPERLWQEPVRDAVNKAIQPFGYYSADMRIFEEDAEIIINVYMSEPLIVENLTLEVIGEGRTDTWFAERFKQFPMQTGEVLQQHLYDKFKSDMLATAISRGYFDFTWQAARLDLVRETFQANVLLVAQSGPRYRIGSLRFKGDIIAREIIEKINPLKIGDFYSAQAISEFNRILNQTGYFTRAVARPLVSQADGTNVPIEVTVTHKPRDLYDIGVGVSTDIGPQISAKWQRPWVNSDGNRITSELFLSEPEQQYTANYRIPMADVNNDYLNFQIGIERTDNEDTLSDNRSLSVHRFWKPLGSEWQQSVSLRYQNETFAQGADPRQTTELVLPGYSLSLFRSRGGLDITWGNRTFFTIEGGAQDLLSDIDIVRVNTKTKWIRSFGKHRWIARAELGALSSSDFDRVPSSLRFFAGGDQSIRGFGYDEIAPKNENDELIGARYLAVGSLEYGYDVAENWRISTFFDVGTATNDFDEDLSWGAGLGVHYLSIIGPIRIYIAHGEPNAEQDVTFHFSIGPEL